jgi:Fic family protein
MRQDNYDRKMEHLLSQGYSKEEVDEALTAKRKEHLASEIAKPTPVAKMTIKNALETLVKRDFHRPMESGDPTALMA